MKIQKSIAVLFALSALFVTAVQAQDQGKRKGGEGGRGMMSPEARVEQLDKALTLTADQKTKITEIYKKAADDMRETMRAAKESGDRDAARQKMMDAMKATREQVRALLTDEQKKKFDEMPQRGGGDQGGRRGKKQQ